MNKLKCATMLNICLFALEVFAVSWMISGISGGILSASRLSVLKLFTVDSNILLGIAALIAAIDEGKNQRTPHKTNEPKFRRDRLKTP